MSTTSDAVSHRGAERLRNSARSRFARSVDVPARFFETNADTISRACLEMARRFRRGGRLLAFGTGAQATDAEHVAVEFVHPVLVGKQALPALALAADSASLTGAATAGGSAAGFARLLAALGTPADIALGIAADGGAALHDPLACARARGMLTVALVGEAPEVGSAAADFVFAVPCADALVVQETHETLYHVLWELVHVFFEHGVAG